MASNNNDSNPRGAPTIALNPFSIIAKSAVASDKPTKYTRNIATRKGAILLKGQK